MSDREQQYIQEAFDANWGVPLGPNANVFEKELKEFVGGNQVVALSAGTAAVHLALLACGVGLEDEVICQSFTFCASAHLITYLGVFRYSSTPSGIAENGLFLLRESLI